MTRCPYCHDAFDDYGRVCAVCLARHHDDCWSEGGGCASCAGQLPLSVARDEVPARGVWRAIAFLSLTPTGLLGFCGGGMWLSYAHSAQRGGLDLSELLILLVSFLPALSTVLLPLALVWVVWRGPLAPAGRVPPRPGEPPRARLDLSLDLRGERSHLGPLIGAKRRVRATGPGA